MTMPSTVDLALQQRLLPRVSRTFALTIPELPAGLREVVTNAYLLCRLADTIEDDPNLGCADKAALMAELAGALTNDKATAAFAQRLGARLSSAISAAEHDLVANASAILRIAASFPEPQRRAVIRGVLTMVGGMPDFLRVKTLDGLATLQELDRYCYFVAGVVGEMLTELFCDHCPAVASRRDVMMSLAVRFGQGLQMTNILKDIWEDREAMTCWLPRNLFAAVPGGLGQAIARRDAMALTAGINDLIGVARGHLAAALRYTQLLPKSEPGLRRFCLWAIGMAVLTLRKIHRSPGFTSGRQVKISRVAVRGTVLACNLALFSNRALGALFAIATYGLPDEAPGGTLPPDADLATDGPAS
jgi:farnesyl-diphosphate farnesyltransferase